MFSWGAQVVGSSSSVLLGRRTRDYTIFRDEDQRRAWIAVPEESLVEARRALDVILLQKSRAEDVEQVCESCRVCGIQ